MEGSLSQTLMDLLHHAEELEANCERAAASEDRLRAELGVARGEREEALRAKRRTDKRLLDSFAVRDTLRGCLEQAQKELAAALCRCESLLDERDDENKLRAENEDLGHKLRDSEGRARLFQWAYSSLLGICR